MSSPFLTPAQLNEFKKTGALILRNFYDPQKDLLPIQRAIYDIIGLIIDKYSLPIERRPFSQLTFDDGYQHLIASRRSFGGEVYDAVKQIPGFFRLISDPKHQQVFSELRAGSMPGVAAGGYGIRIDNPSEEKYMAPWHQEYPAQLRSLDGLVFWSPLLEMTEAMGPVEICVGSQTEGAVPVYTVDPKNPGKSGAYALTLKDEESLIQKFETISPLTSPGDVVVLDFLVIHRSGFNRSDRSRWTMQFRYFNFMDPVGRKHGWKGSYAAGTDFREIHPELCLDHVKGDRQ